MDINTTLFKALQNSHFFYFDDYSKINEFLFFEGDFFSRRKYGEEIIENILANNGKKRLVSSIVQMGKIEYGTRGLKEWARDHVVHALLTFILGIYINEKFLFDQKECFVDTFQWKIASLFHDIGYPLEIANSICGQYKKTINSIITDITNNGNNNNPVNISISKRNINSLDKNKTCYGYIYECLRKWELDDTKIRKYVENTGRNDHGVISGITLLHIIDKMYSKHNPNREERDIYIDGDINCNQKYFLEDIIPSCSAIFVHNLPEECFTNKKILYNKAPLAFLLRLSDTLQEWERPSIQNEKGYSSKDFDILIDKDKRLIFQAKFPNEANREYLEMSDVLSKILGSKDIIIEPV